MKQNKLTLWLLSLIAVGCQSDPEIATPTTDAEGDTSRITITASTGADTKISFTEGVESISLAWEDGDSFEVYDTDNKLVSTFKYSGVAGAASGVFTQEASDNNAMVSGNYTAVIGKDYTTNSQVVEDIESLDHLKNYVRLSCNFTYTEGEPTSIVFSHELSLIKLNITTPGGVVPASVALTDGENSYSLTLPAGVGQRVSTYMAVESNDVNEARDLTFIITDTYGVEHECVKNSDKDFVAGKFYSATIDIDVDYYEKGYTTPDGATYSKADGTLITSDATISTNGVYFVEPGVTISLPTSTAYFNNLVIIGRYSHTKANVECNNRLNFGTGDGLVWKNLNIVSNYNNYLVDSTGESNIMDRWVIEDCYFESYPDKPLSAFYDKKYFAIKNIIMQNNIFNFPANTANAAIRIVNFNTTLNSDLSNYESFTFTNNIVYTPSSYSGGSVLMMNDKESDISTFDYKITVSNNTFVNFLGNSGTALLVLQNGSITVENNLMWASSDISVHSNMFNFRNPEIPSTGPIALTYDGNIFYGLNINTHNWQKFNTGTNYGYVGGENLFDRLSSSPLTTCDLNNGIFIKDPAYESKGATLNW